MMDSCHTLAGLPRRLLQVCLLVATTLLTTVSTGTDIHTKEVCNMETFNARCSNDEVVVMVSARYGRMRKGHCVVVDYGNLGCISDVLRYFDKLCSGRRECTVKVPDDHLYSHNVCPKDVTPYLEASYKCVKVTSGAGLMTQCMNDGLVRLKQSTGTIASVVVAETRSGGHECPWVIQAQPGQRINITLMDFGSSETAGTDSNTLYRPTCHKYGVLQERTVTSPTTVCSGREREKNIYLSQGSRVEIQFVHDRTSKHPPHFFLKYNILGCPNPTLRGNVLVKRTPERAVLKCNSTGQQWYLYCHQTTWNGAVEDCAVLAKDWSVWRVLSEEWASPKGILITVGLGIALGTIVGVALLICVLVFLKRHKYKRPAKFQQSGPQVDYDGTEADVDDTTLPKWDVETKDSGYGPGSGHYSQVWNGGDSTGPGEPPFMEPLIGHDSHVTSLPRMPRLPPLPTPPSVPDTYSTGDHVYEKPK